MCDVESACIRPFEHYLVLIQPLRRKKVAGKTREKTKKKVAGKTPGKNLEIFDPVNPPPPPHGEVTFENLKFEKVEKFVRAYNVCCLRYALYMTINALDCSFEQINIAMCDTRIV